MELSTPEPWLPVVRTCSEPSGAAVTRPRWYSVRPGFLRMASPLRARSSGGAGRFAAAHHAQQGRAHEGEEGHHHRHRVAGQAEQDRTLPMRPTAIGRPGRMAMRQNATSPSFFIMALV